MEDNILINPDKLDDISGGVIFNATGIVGSDANNPWEVLDDKDGHVVARFSTEWAARSAVGGLNENYMEVNWNQVQQLRGQA